MANLRHFFFYGLACLAFPIAAITFIFNDSLAAFFIHASKVEIAPQYTGGKIQEIIDHGGYVTSIHEPIFEGCCAFSSKRIVQIDWEVKIGNVFPFHIHEDLSKLGVEIDWDTTKKEANIKGSLVTASRIYDLGTQKKMLRLLFQKQSLN